MKIKLKNYKLSKIKDYYKNEKILLIFDTSNLNTKTWVKIEQNLKNLNLKTYKIFNIIKIIFLKTTIFKNLHTSINGPLKLISFKNKKSKLDLKILTDKIKNFQLSTIKLNNKIYSQSQIKNIKILNYKTNIRIFNKTLKNFSNFNVLKLTKNSK